MFFKLLNKVSKQNTSWNVKRDNGCRENTAIINNFARIESDCLFKVGLSSFIKSIS